MLAESLRHHLDGPTNKETTVLLVVDGVAYAVHSAYMTREGYFVLLAGPAVSLEPNGDHSEGEKT